MKFYLCDGGSHHKNRTAIRQMMEANGATYTEHTNLNAIDDSYDVALCMTQFFPPSAFPARCKVVYGPQFFVFPDNMSHPIHKHTYDPDRFFFNILSDWVKKVYIHKAPRLSLRFITCPLGLDLDNIQEVPPLLERQKVMIYFKHRHPSALDAVRQFLEAKGQEYVVISYGSYNDADFKAKLKESRFVIWVGSHESQGFAFQETQASNIPILLWDVHSMRDEYNGSWPYGQSSGQPDELAATTATCWSDDCGIKFYRGEDLASTYDEMCLKLETFRPRAFITDKLSLTATYERLVTTIGL